MMFLSLTYIILLFKYSPFANLYLNMSEKVSHLSLFFMHFSAILFLCRSHPLRSLSRQ